MIACSVHEHESHWRLRLNLYTERRVERTEAARFQFRAIAMLGATQQITGGASDIASDYRIPVTQISKIIRQMAKVDINIKKPLLV